MVRLKLMGFGIGVETPAEFGANNLFATGYGCG